MATISKLAVTLSAVTPLFIGGAEPNERAEFRPSSLKGLMRYWYRALDGEYNHRERRDDPTREEELFGGTDAGQSPCLIRVNQWTVGTDQWARERYRREFQRGPTTTGQNGIGYLGYTLALERDTSTWRRAIGHNRRATLDILVRPDLDSLLLRRAWLAALWLLVHVGGIGSRCHRGLGSLRIDDWHGWEECDTLPLPCRAASAEQWRTEMDSSMQTLHAWFRRPAPETGHTTLATGARMLLLKPGYRHWEQALDDAGLRLQQFRQRREPDYGDVKAHLGRQRALTAGPERAGFGLPLSFRFTSLASTDQSGKSRTPAMTFVGTDHDRMASPLFIRVLHLGQQYHAAFAHLPAPLLPPGERLKDQGDRSGEQEWPESAAATRVVSEFLNSRVQTDALEVAL